MQRPPRRGGRAVALLLLALPLGAAEPTPADQTGDATTAGGGEDAAPQPYLGIVVRATTEADFDGQAGLVVDRTFPRTTAVELGLQRGDLITRFNEQPVASREDLKKLLDGLKVGDKVTVSFLRDGARQAAVAQLQPRPTRQSVSQELDKARDTVSELQEERARQLADLEQARREEKTLAESMQELSAVLSALPEQLDQTARQFKAVYPDGEFTVDIRVTIRSHPGSEEAIDLSPATVPPTTGTDDQAAAESPPAQPDAPNPPATDDDLVPPPTK